MQDLSDFIDLPTAVERSGYGESTLRRHIKSGKIPAVKIKGRVHIRPQDLETFTAPEPMRPTDATLEDWASRMAAKAPAFRPEQRKLILAAFSTALGGE
ncbi:helix-turn-helix domain-containing protein [Leifsonia sp. P73]|uniref:helix-turn-helix domain-containing protein n=1 Tax=Leifsonia sp. P73 TaxID=3423959 RepID=UPI003DA47377